MYLLLNHHYLQNKLLTMNQFKKKALDYHSKFPSGKIKISPTKKYKTQEDLSLAYSPGVAEPCKEISHNPQKVYKYTNKGNLVAVITNGTAVLGLGNIGPLASKPVMEGKALLFKIFSGIDVFDIEINETDVEKFIKIVKSIAPTFGGINLEDIKAPEAFEIENRLKKELNIPIMHDDQHGTAIISGAALINAIELVNKDIKKVKMVVNGAGSAAISCTRIYKKLGVKFIDISLKKNKISNLIYNIISSIEVMSNLSRFDGIKYGKYKKNKNLYKNLNYNRNFNLGKEVKKRILMGLTYSCPKYYKKIYLKSLKLRYYIYKEYYKIFNNNILNCDAILMPIFSDVAYNINSKNINNKINDIFTISNNLSGLPSISIPCGYIKNKIYKKKNINFQIIGNFYKEKKILNIAHKYQDFIK
uniref:Malic enzyme n=1 Tax=Clastoptera arizonana TaxID=38151 RepID=A0A1B6D3E4_9HEMI